MKGRKTLVVLAVLLALAALGAGGYYGWRLIQSRGAESRATPDTAAMAFLDALVRGDQDDMAELTAGPDGGVLAQTVLSGYSGELERIRAACGGLKLAGIISEVVEGNGDEARVRATVTFDCPGDVGVEFLDAELRLERRDGAWGVARD